MCFTCSLTDNLMAMKLLSCVYNMLEFGPEWVVAPEFDILPNVVFKFKKQNVLI